jgi:hypothetical protein
MPAMHPHTHNNAATQGRIFGPAITRLASQYGNSGTIRKRLRGPGAGGSAGRLGHRGLALPWRPRYGLTQVCRERPDDEDVNSDDHDRPQRRVR